MNSRTAIPNVTLVFDWGDTLMRVFSQYDGPMAEWPEVAAVEGAVQALAPLRGQVSMVVASNAGDSSAQQVRQALERVGLADYFQTIFTARELGARKPDEVFFQAVEQSLELPARALVMVGDDYKIDVLGAKAAGWRAAWYNRHGQAAPAAAPLHDIEIRSLPELPAALAAQPLPDMTTCLGWLQARGVPYNIIAHVTLVAGLAYLLACDLRSRGEQVDPVMTHRGALLHDIAKIEAGRDRDHAEMAAEILRERGQPVLAGIALRHMPYTDPADPRRPHTWEEKLVHFADKLSEGDRLVDLAERKRALQGRYPQWSGEVERAWPHLLRLQEEICQRLGRSPEAMMQRLREGLGLQWATARQED